LILLASILGKRINNTLHLFQRRMLSDHLTKCATPNASTNSDVRPSAQRFSWAGSDDSSHYVHMAPDRVDVDLSNPSFAACDAENDVHSNRHKYTFPQNDRVPECQPSVTRKVEQYDLHRDNIPQKDTQRGASQSLVLKANKVHSSPTTIVKEFFRLREEAGSDQRARENTTSGYRCTKPNQFRTMENKVANCHERTAMSRNPSTSIHNKRYEPYNKNFETDKRKDSRSSAIRTTSRKPSVKSFSSPSLASSVIRPKRSTKSVRNAVPTVSDDTALKQVIFRQKSQRTQRPAKNDTADYEQLLPNEVKAKPCVKHPVLFKEKLGANTKPKPSPLARPVMTVRPPARKPSVRSLQRKPSSSSRKPTHTPLKAQDAEKHQRQIRHDGKDEAKTARRRKHSVVSTKVRRNSRPSSTGSPIPTKAAHARVRRGIHLCFIL